MLKKEKRVTPPKIFNTMLHVKNAAEIENHEIKERNKRKIVFPIYSIKFFDTLDGNPSFV